MGAWHVAVHANIQSVYIGSGRRRNRGNGSAWLILLLIGLVLVGGYTLIQQRLGNGLGLSSPNATAVPSVTPTRSVENFVSMAEDAYRKGDYRNAIAYYEQASRRRPNDVSLYTLAARLMVFLGQAPKAEQRALKALQIDASNAPAKAVLCMAIDWQGRYEEALPICQAAIALDPHSSMAFAYLAEVQTDNGDVRSGRASANQALTLDPKNEDAMRNLAYTYEQGSSYADAIYYYEETLKLNPNMPHVLISLGRSYIVQGQIPKGILYLKRAIDIDPLNAEAYDRLGGAYFAIGEYDQSRLMLDKAIDLDPMRVTVWTRKGILDFQVRKYEAAVVDYTRALTTSKIVSATLSITDYINYGFALQLTDDCTRAIPIFNEVGAMAPTDK
ncbi:MAG TPA: tetratricopeptide repeat protein, partial [Armatimonadota bacterium]